MLSVIFESVPDSCVSTVPTAAPVNVTLYATTPRTLLINWKPPPLGEQNGDITNYTLIIADENGADVREEVTEELELVVGGLQPFQLYYVHLAASTSVGLGPHTSPLLIEMPEDGNMVLSSTVCRIQRSLQWSLR